MAVATTPRSWLDKVQKDAQDHEMDHKNTSSAFFLLLVGLQVGAAFLVSTTLLTPRFTVALALCFGQVWCCH